MDKGDIKATVGILVLIIGAGLAAALIGRFFGCGG